MMSAGIIDCITTPSQGNRIPPGAWFCADNGAYGKGYPGDAAWWAWVQGLPRDRCRFVVAPDVVGDAAATAERSAPWLPRIRSAGHRAAFVAQDGLEGMAVPWGAFDVLFIGGTTAWKLGAAARRIVATSNDHGIPVHMGRVNSFRRLRYADAIGCASADGTYLTYGPDLNVERVLWWLREINHQGAFDFRAGGGLSSRA